MTDPNVGRASAGEAPSVPASGRKPLRLPGLRDIGYGALLALAALFLYIVYSGAHTQELTDPNAMDYAQIARHLSRGEGFTTSFLRPLSLAQAPNVSHHPDLSYVPLHPLWMSLFFRLGGASYRMAAWSCGVAYLLTLPFVYLLALRLFDRRAALLALGLYAVNYLSLQYAVSGLEVSLASLVITVLALLLHLYVTSARPSILLAVLCGTLAAAAFLVKEVYLVLLLPVLGVVLLRRGERRWTEAVIALAAFALVTVPWGVRTAQVTGNPLFSLRSAELVSNTKTYKGQSLYRRFVTPVPGALGFIVQHPKEMWVKMRPTALAMYDALPNLGGAFVACFFLVAVFVRFRDESLAPLRRWLYASLLLVATALCLLSADARLLVPLGALVVVIGAGHALLLIDRLAESVQGARQRRRLVGWAVGGLVAVCWFPVLAMTASMEQRDTALTDDVRKLCLALADRKVHPIYSDQPWVLAWYGDIDALWLPQTEEDMTQLEETIGPVSYMLLSPLLPRAAQEEGLTEYGRLYALGRRGVSFQRFMLADTLGANRDWLLFGRAPEDAETGADALP